MLGGPRRSLTIFVCGSRTGPDHSSTLRVTLGAMKAVAGWLVVWVTCTAPLNGQERDRSLERMRLALQQPAEIGRGVSPVETAVPKTFGMVTFVPPTLPGEMVRVTVPIGELVSRAFKGAAAANRRRQEAAARRTVEADLESFKEQQTSRKP